MNALYFWFAAIVAGIGIVTFPAVFWPKPVFIRLASLLGTIALIAAVFVSLVSTLGVAKPLELEWRRADLTDAEVVSHVLVEDVAIFLWIRRAGGADPIAYRLPWSLEQAKQLTEAARESRQNGTSLRVQVEPPVDSEDPAMAFHPQPPERRAAKARDDEDVFRLRGS